MNRRRCSVPWCNKQAKPGGTLCSTHYEERRIHGYIRTPEEKAADKQRFIATRKHAWRHRHGWGQTCRVEGCARKPRIRGYCSKHYSRWRIHGDPRVNKRNGRIVASSGYILVKKHGHPRADVRGYVREHILVAEATLGRPLKRGEVVHHINANHSDNRPENLAIMPGRIHILLHAALNRGENMESFKVVPISSVHDLREKEVSA